MRKHFEVAAFIGLGVLLGLGIAAWRASPPILAAAAQEKGKKPAGIYSPPGTFEGGTVVPNPGPAPFKGKIGQTITESTPDWPPMASARKGSPNVLFIVLDDVGFAALGC